MTKKKQPERVKKISGLWTPPADSYREMLVNTCNIYQLNPFCWLLGKCKYNSEFCYFAVKADGIIESTTMKLYEFVLEFHLSSIYYADKELS